MRNDKIKLGISIGDINGIGMEVIIKALQDPAIFHFFTPIIYGSPQAGNFYRKLLNIEDFSFQNIGKTEEANPKRANMLSIWNEDIEIIPGKSTDTGGKYAFISLKAAVEDLASNKIDVLVTAPINKKNIQSSEFDFPGHTEYLAKYANVKQALMLLISDEFRVGTVTSHIPLKDVSAALNQDLILDKIADMERTLKQDFSISRPKIAVLGLNPHAGDDGLLGTEENEIIIPAIQKARERGALAFGPFPADGFFGSSAYQHYDGILAMYHDQGLAPFKALTFDQGVNFTAGLPIVRTSPDHGTAYSIAGLNQASENSIRNAMYLACEIYKNRKDNKSLVANALTTG